MDKHIYAEEDMRGSLLVPTRGIMPRWKRQQPPGNQVYVAGYKWYAT